MKKHLHISSIENGAEGPNTEKCVTLITPSDETRFSIMKMRVREVIGFTSIFLSLSLFLAAFAVAAPKKEKAAAGGGDGQKIFEGKCAQCHGKDAKGVVKMAKVLKTEPVEMDLTRADAVKLTDAEIVTTVTNGKKKMPKYKGKLTDEQVQSVVKYLRTIQGSGASK